MEKIFRSVTLFLLFGSILGYAQIPDWAKSFEQIVTQNGINKNYSSYMTEKIDYEGHHVKPISNLNLEDNTVYIQFFSQLKGNFSFYINGNFMQQYHIDTFINSGGELELDMYPFKIPDGENTAILKIISLEYGSVITEIKKNHPMIYIKLDKLSKDWYIDHTDVDRYAPMYFSN